MADSTTHYGLTKPLGTEYYNISVPNGNMDKIDTALHALGSGLAIIATGDTHAAAASGDFIYIHSHGTLAEGLYKATTSIAQNAALSGSNVTAVTGGGLNALASNTNTALAGKVDKVTGKGLSTNDYTTTEKTKLSGIQDGAQVNPGNATSSAAGLMSSTDKSKLDGIAAGANNYSLPLAANGTRGGVQVGYSQNAKNYPVQLSSEKMYVNVPWTDTTYSPATTSANGLMSAADKTKLNGISSGANNGAFSIVSADDTKTVATGLQNVTLAITVPAGYTAVAFSKFSCVPTSASNYNDLEVFGYSVSNSYATAYVNNKAGTMYVTMNVKVLCIKFA